MNTQIKHSLLSWLVLLMLIAIVSTSAWAADSQTATLTMKNSNTSPVTVNGVTFTWTSSDIVTGTNNGSGFKANSNMTITIPSGATLTGISKTNGTQWGSGAAITVYAGSSSSGTQIASIVTGTNSYTISKNNTGTTYYLANSTKKNAWINSLAITYTVAAKEDASITLHDANGSSTVSSKYVGDSYTLPTTAASCTGKVLVGWSTVEVAETNTKPTTNFYEKGASVTLSASNTFYAVFANLSSTFTRVTNVSNLKDGSPIVIIDAKNSKVLTTGIGNATAPTETNSKITVTDASYIWELEKSDTNWKVKTGTSYLGVSNTSNGTAVSKTTINNVWTIAASSNTSYTNCFYLKNTQGTNYCLEWNSSNSTWVCYGNRNYGSSEYFTEKLYISSYTAYSTSCCTPLGTIKGSVNVTKVIYVFSNNYVKERLYVFYYVNYFHTTICNSTIRERHQLFFRKSCSVMIFCVYPI